MLQEASRLVQDGLLEPIWTPHGPKLSPSWLKLGLCWPQIRAPAAPEPTQTLPDPFPSPSRTHSRGYSPSARPGQLDLEPWNTFWTSQTPNLDLKTARHGSKKDLPRLQILSAQARWLGRSLFNRVLKGLGRDLEGFGLAQGRLGARIWWQHGPNLSQVGANLGPT